MEQALDLKGISNARELGGYAADGGYIKKGVLLRTGGLCGASPEELNKLRDNYRLRTVIDFRMSDERERDPDPEIAGVENYHLPVIEIEDYPAPDPKMYEDYLRSGDRMTLFEMSYEMGMLSSGMYVDFLLRERGKAAYKSFFRILTEAEDGAVLWHCTDGKDRTGCAAMLILSALGASRETIMKDYMLTNVYNAARIEAVREKTAALDMPEEKRETLLFTCGGVYEQYMMNALKALDENYGGAPGYLRSELGMGDAELKFLREKYISYDK